VVFSFPWPTAASGTRIAVAAESGGLGRRIDIDLEKIEHMIIRVKAFSPMGVFE
jgi:hypothetical protein